MQMEESLKASLIMVVAKAKGNRHGQMVQHILESGTRISVMGKGKCFGQVV